MFISDYEKIYDLWLNTPGMGLNDYDDSKEGIERYLLRNPNTCFVAESGGEIVGAILSGHNGRRGTINHLAVTKHEREKGIGSALVRRAEEALNNEGIKKIHIIVFKNNAEGNLFWEKRGYTVPGETLCRAKNIDA